MNTQLATGFNAIEQIIKLLRKTHNVHIQMRTKSEQEYQVWRHKDTAKLLLMESLAFLHYCLENNGIGTDETVKWGNDEYISYIWCDGETYCVSIEARESPDDQDSGADNHKSDGQDSECLWN